MPIWLSFRPSSKSPKPTSTASGYFFCSRRRVGDVGGRVENENSRFPQGSGYRGKRLQRQQELRDIQGGGGAAEPANVCGPFPPLGGVVRESSLHRGDHGVVGQRAVSGSR